MAIERREFLNLDVWSNKMKVVFVILALVFVYANAHETYCYDPALIVDNKGKTAV